MVSLLALDLGLAGRPLAASLRPPPGTDLARRAHRPPPAIHASLGHPARRYRVLYTPDSYFMLQNAGLLHGYDNLRAYSPVLLRRTWDLLSLADHGHFARWWRLPVDHNHNFLRNVHSPIARLLGVKWVLSHDRGGRPGVRRDLRWRVRTQPQPLPRAFLVHRTRLATTSRRAEQVLRRLHPDQEAVVASRAGLLPRPTHPPSPTATDGQGENVQILVRSPCTGEARMAVTAHAPALLVFTEAYYPGWRARIDGRPAPVVRTDHALLGVVVPAGTHRVQLTFHPRSLRVGAVVSGVTLGVLLLLLLLLSLKQFRSIATPM